VQEKMRQSIGRYLGDRLLPLYGVKQKELLTRALAVLGASAVITLAVIYAWVRHLPNSSRLSGLLLRDGLAAGGGFISAPVREDLVGRDGVAVTDLRPSGTAVFGEERVDVVTEGEFISQGSPLRVLRSEGYRLVVRAAV
jgi:membrane-bound serine protease (ClpP class)